ncbi:MAG: glutamyl-tRNA reductase [Acidobacteria bacterium]|nr:glutamyl-tRNA reductase [Acidobacteriota bacterium]
MIVVVGLSHHTAPLEMREALAFPRERMGEALERLREESGLAEAMILSTCNRVEIYGRAPESAAEPVAEFLAGFHDRRRDELDSHLYRLEGEAAVRHAFRVAASLDSMVLGEPQILGQVKKAYEAAEEAGALGSVLNTLRNRSLAAAKRARTETAIGRNAVSVSHVAVELARKIFGNLRERSVLLVGAGKMSEVAARQMVRDGARATVLGGRTLERAEQLAAALGGRAAPLEALRSEMSRVDVVISGTGAPGLVVRREDVDAAQAARRHRPLFLIDIAVPRDIEPEAGKVNGVFLYDLDDLRSVAEANLRERGKEAAQAEAILDQEIRAFLDWRESLDVVPLLVELRSRADEIRRAEVDKARRRLGPLTPEQEKAVEAMTSGIVNKLLHPPTVELKKMASNRHHTEYVGLIRKLFGL